MLVIGNLCAGISVILLCVSVFRKKKEGILIVQSFDCTFCILADILVGSYSGAVISFLALVRNIVNVKGKMTVRLGLVFCTIASIVSLLVNTKGIIGTLPILATIEFTVGTAYYSDAQKIRFLMIPNIILWMIHDICIGLYTSAIGDLITLIATIVACRKYS